MQNFWQNEFGVRGKRHRKISINEMPARNTGNEDENKHNNWMTTTTRTTTRTRTRTTRTTMRDVVFALQQRTAQMIVLLVGWVVLVLLLAHGAVCGPFEQSDTWLWHSIPPGACMHNGRGKL